MPRVVVIKQETDVETLVSSTLLSARASDAQASAAIDAFKRLNQIRRSSRSRHRRR